MFFSKYNSTKIYWIKKHRSKNYSFAENIEKNNKISKAFIDKYINQISDINSFHELGLVQVETLIFSCNIFLI